ncbi:hypothetical protein M0813_06072 [Anaeramoeba flamelloides]|uniref:Uncharacterized protein n=1 Tax=Anaeramoeba flamelloides TaxID=1746091 RepID=A0AAV7YFJ6_9EUKA|nr:hypothetical protein M0812_25836 [Anaeramoeba flamelloides]KAJ6231343.1 hypothetical protein M0813_06072 [Anaeramoeba flamelloides]
MLSLKSNLETKFIKECSCSKKEAQLFLNAAKDDFMSGLGLYVLTRLISKTNPNTLSGGLIKMKNTLIQDEKKMRNYESRQVDKIDQRELTCISSPRYDEEELEQQQQQQEEEQRTNMIINETGKLYYKGLVRFLNQKPTPPWRERLRAFKSYDPELVQGYPRAMFTREKITINKNLFKIYLQINKGEISSKNLQRGVIAFFERNGFQKVDDRSRTKMVFLWKKY